MAGGNPQQGPPGNKIPAGPLSGLPQKILSPGLPDTGMKY